MSILTGIICADAIVLGADSQFTDPWGVVSFGDKISTVEFDGGNDVLVAQAGLPAITKRIVELMSEKAKSVVIKNALTVTEIVEDSIRHLKNKSTPDQWEAGCNGGGAYLMVAFYANNKPCLYTINVYGHGAMSEPENRHFAVAGVGAPLAEYLLSQFSPPRALWNVQSVTTVYVIGKVKVHQKGACGGETKLKMLFPKASASAENEYIGKAKQYYQPAVNTDEKLLLEQDASENKIRKWMLMLEEHAMKLEKNLENTGENKP